MNVGEWKYSVRPPENIESKLDHSGSQMKMCLAVNMNMCPSLESTAAESCSSTASLAIPVRNE